MKLGVIDYGAGNLRSVLNTFEAAGVTGHLVRTPEDAAGVTHLVLPGVGAFGDCAEKLRSQELVPLIRTWIGQDKPFLGICVGYQVLFETGEEDEQVPGLGIFKGRVVRFAESELKVPHMGMEQPDSFQSRRSHLERHGAGAVLLLCALLLSAAGG